MKKVILSLVIGGLSIGGDCFAVGLADANSQQNKQTNSLVQVKSGLSKVGVKTKEALKRKDVQIALGTAAVIGSGVAAYYFVPGVSNFVNSNAKTALDVVKNSNQYKLVSSKLLEMGKAIKSSNAFKAIQNSKVGSLLGIKPKPSKVEKVVNGAANIWNSHVVPNWNYYIANNWNSYVVPNWNYYVVNNWNRIPTWVKWTTGGVVGTVVAVLTHQVLSLNLALGVALETI